ncbi:hypothetical protein [Streptococcus mitis]|jgi:hypothetical protein|uniref:hypothetical protein n=1 Tax=Streptococcus mitis TaxID=28037 RepID=UPI0021B6E046|nr:hypothetical protein [Streptococcus mitis]
MEKKIEARIEHLKMIQTNISRMASNSFIVKGWSVTSIGAIYAFWLTSKNNYLLWLILGVTILFWFHDAYYLMLERAYRKLYDSVRLKDVSDDEFETFEMSPIMDENIFYIAFSRKILWLPYGLISIVIVIILIFNTR